MPRSHVKEQDVPRNMELDKMFAQEVRTRQENIRQQAVQSVLARHEFGDEVTVQEFINGLRNAKDMWDVVSNMSIVAFSDCIGNARYLTEENQRLRAEIAALQAEQDSGNGHSSRRTRLSNAQKAGLKQAILQVLQNRPEGLARLEVAAQVPDSKLKELGLPRQGLPSKLRIPIAELLAEGLVGTQGEKRFMRYLLGQGDTRRAILIAGGTAGAPS